MTATTELPDVPLPAGFVTHVDWAPGHRLSTDETRAWRLIRSTDRAVTDCDACVTIRGVQYSDGRLDDEIAILVEGGCDDGLNTDQARELAAALLEAADEMERLGGTESP